MTSQLLQSVFLNHKKPDGREINFFFCIGNTFYIFHELRAILYTRILYPRNGLVWWSNSNFNEIPIFYIYTSTSGGQGESEIWIKITQLQAQQQSVQRRWVSQIRYSSHKTHKNITLFVSIIIYYHKAYPIWCENHNLTKTTMISLLRGRKYINCLDWTRLSVVSGVDNVD